MSDSGAALFLGGDVGGSSTRIAVSDRTGAVVGRGLGGPGNPLTDPNRAAASLRAALADALRDVDLGRIRAAALGIAGCGPAGQPPPEWLMNVWHDAGLACPPALVTDCEVAFASATDGPDGTVLIAGTGSVAVAIRNHEIVRRVGGHGWYLGDEGSGFWLGRQALRHVLDTVERRAPMTHLSAAVLRELGCDAAGDPEELRELVIDAAYRRDPAQVAGLGPLVTAAASDDDHAAQQIVAEAGAALAALVDRARDGHEQGPVVLAGAVAVSDNAVARALRDRLAERHGARVVTVTDAVPGALALAIRLAAS